VYLEDLFGLLAGAAEEAALAAAGAARDLPRDRHIPAPALDGLAAKAAAVYAAELARRLALYTGQEVRR
jgi:hypothetical protein